MHCDAARELLEVCRPDSDDLRAPQLSEAADHLDGCAACRDWFGAIQSFDRAVRRAMRDVAVPLGLRQRLLDQTAAVQSDDRRGRRLAEVLRSPRIWLGAGSLAAACLLVIVWLGSRPTRVTVAEVEEAARVRFDDEIRLWQMVDDQFEAKVALSSAEQRRLQEEAPSPAKVRSPYRGLLVEDFLGRRVVVYCYYFDFVPRPIQAQVYVLPAEQFQFDGPIDRDPSVLVPVNSASGLTTATWQEGEFVYVLVYRGSPDVLEQTITRPGPLTMAAAAPFSRHLR